MGALVFAVSSAIVLKSCYKRCPSNKVTRRGGRARGRQQGEERGEEEDNSKEEQSDVCPYRCWWCMVWWGRNQASAYMVVAHSLFPSFRATNILTSLFLSPLSSPTHLFASNYLMIQTYISLEPMQIDVNLKAALSKENIRLTVPSYFTGIPFRLSSSTSSTSSTSPPLAYLYSSLYYSGCRN